MKQNLDQCWEWKVSTAPRRYGKKSIEKHQYSTHRLVWAWANWNGVGDWKAVPVGMEVLHRCDNPPCCNPDHLFLGTQRDNTLDAIAKGRHATANKPNCKRGHSFAIHGYPRRNGMECRVCRADAMKRFRARNQEVGRA